MKVAILRVLLFALLPSAWIAFALYAKRRRHWSGLITHGGGFIIGVLSFILLGSLLVNLFDLESYATNSASDPSNLQDQITQKYSANQQNQYLVLQKEANGINKGLPMMISSEMQLSRVIARSYNEIAYILKDVVLLKEQMNPNLITTTIKSTTRNSICSNPDTLAAIQKGIKYTYSFYDKNNTYVFEYSITPKDCSM